MKPTAYIYAVPLIDGVKPKYKTYTEDMGLFIVRETDLPIEKPGAFNSAGMFFSAYKKQYAQAMLDAGYKPAWENAESLRMTHPWLVEQWEEWKSALARETMKNLVETLKAES